MASDADIAGVTVADVDGVPTVEVRVHATVPPLGLWGPGVELDVVGHGVRELAP